LRSDETILSPPSTQLPAGLPAWITIKDVEDTLQTFQPFYAETLTVEDAIGMLMAVDHLFDALKDHIHAEVQSKAVEGEPKNRESPRGKAVRGAGPSEQP
jgi:hypothetical protein